MKFKSLILRHLYEALAEILSLGWGIVSNILAVLIWIFFLGFVGIESGWGIALGLSGLCFCLAIGGSAGAKNSSALFLGAIPIVLYGYYLLTNYFFGDFLAASIFVSGSIIALFGLIPKLDERYKLKDIGMVILMIPLIIFTLGLMVMFFFWSGILFIMIFAWIFNLDIPPFVNVSFASLCTIVGMVLWFRQ